MYFFLEGEDIKLIIFWIIFIGENLISNSDYKDYKNIYNDYFLYHLNILKLPNFEHIIHDKKDGFIKFCKKSNKRLKILLWTFVFLISSVLILEFIDDFIIDIH